MQQFRSGWMVISQKHLNFRMKRNCMVQGKMGCNGLGNRCSIQNSGAPPDLHETSSSAQGQTVSVRRVLRAEPGNSSSPPLRLRTQCGHDVF